MSLRAGSISSGAEHILRHNLGFNQDEINKDKKTILDYSMPQQWGDSLGWVSYIANNVDHIVRFGLNFISRGYLDTKSAWTRFEEKIVNQFACKTIEYTKRRFPDIQAGTEELIPEVKPDIHTRVSKILAACLTAQANQLDREAVVRVKDGALVLNENYMYWLESTFIT